MGFTAVDATFKLARQAVSSAKGDPPDHSAMHYTPHQGSYFAHRITLEGLGEDALGAVAVDSARRPQPASGGRSALRAVVSALEGCLARGRGRPRQDDRGGPRHRPALG